MNNGRKSKLEILNLLPTGQVTGLDFGVETLAVRGALCSEA